jgi:hypothetical protein
MLELKYKIQVSQVHILPSTSVPWRPSTVQMPNLELIETKRITVWQTNMITLYPVDPTLTVSTLTDPPFPPENEMERM